jgi:hypothetical protein
MASCVTCGDELHPERAEKYDYCVKPECQERNAKGLEMVAVGVNKAADQFVILDERTQKEMANGRYKKRPEAAGSSRMPRTVQRSLTPRSVPTVVPRSSGRASRPRWSQAQENLALTYLAMGMKPDEIAKRLGVSRYLVTQILLAATGRGKR